MKKTSVQIIAYLVILMLWGCGHIPDQPKEPPRKKDIPKGEVARAPERPLLYQQPECLREPELSTSLCSAICDKDLDDELLSFAKRYSELSAEGQKKEFSLVTQSMSRNKNDLSARMKAAIIASLPTSRYRDNARAQVLLDDLLHDKAMDFHIRSLATILRDFLVERQKSDENIIKLTQKAKDEQKRADELQQKLDEIRNIEKALIERNQNQKK
jgi:hypothetical protein